MYEFTPRATVVDDQGRSSWGENVQSPFQQASAQPGPSGPPEVAEEEIMAENVTSTPKSSFTEQDFSDPNLHTRFHGNDSLRFHNMLAWDPELGRWVKRTAQSQAVAPREYGAVIHSASFPGGKVAVQATDKESAQAAFTILPMLVKTHLDRPTLPSAGGFRGLPSPYDDRYALPSAEPAPAAQQEVIIQDIATPVTETSEPSPSPQDAPNNVAPATAPNKKNHRFSRAVGKALAITALVTVPPVVLGANQIDKVVENNTGEESSLHFIGKYIPF